MRFIENGPILPTDLLTARDEGQVVFFCGSGVSLARAGLPDFYGLADAVLDQLHASPDSRARAVIAASRSIQVQGVEGLIPADRAFSLLEQEFDTARVRAAVAASLKSKTNDLAAHAALIDLARGTDNKVRLVTTNFDRLFEACDPSIASHAPPDLPHPARSSTFEGIVHLHGVLDKNGEAPLGDKFVISSADFGQAYLSDGWATRFIHALMERYQIVFVGYTANDPPVQYLLEALNTRSATFQPMYALQAGDDDLAKALWLHKGVQPISFDPSASYRALWDTMFAWAERARDPQAWVQAQLAKAEQGPQALQPHERGIIADIASSSSGARQIAKAGASLPAEWLCVFDREMRYRTPSARTLLDDRKEFDPFAVWGLDDDPIPPPVDPENRYAEREIPAEARNILLARRSENDVSSAVGQDNPSGLIIESPSALPERLRLLSIWVTQIAHEPVALWWAAGKAKLHPHLAEWLPRVLAQEPQRFTDQVRRGWRELLASQSYPLDPHGMAFYALEEAIKAEKWSPDFVRKLVALRSPRLEVRRSWSRGAPPDAAASDDLLYRDVSYPNAAIAFDLPAHLLPLHARELGHAVERAIDLELEIASGIYMLGPLHQETDPNGAGGIDDNLTSLFRTWIAALEALIATDPDLVRSELPRWARRTDAVSGRFNIWASGAAGLLSDREAARKLLALDDDIFWDRDHQRDLLYVLAHRWSSFVATDRRKLERRIRKGPATYEGETAEMHRFRAAAFALARLYWLHAHGCTFSFDYDSEVARLKRRYPDWNDQVGEEAAGSIEPKVYTIGERTDFDDLLSVPVAAVAATALTLEHQRLDMQTIRRPFLGLVRDKPARALAALRRAASPPSMRLWEAFLSPEERPPLPERLVVATGCVLANLPMEELTEIVRPVARWVEKEEARLSAAAPQIEERLWSNMLAAFEAYPEKAGSAVLTTGNRHDWLMEAINSATGRLAEVAVHCASDEAAEEDLPPRWLERLGRLISLSGDPGRYAVVTASQNLTFLHMRAPAFAMDYLLPARQGDKDDRAAFWTGVFRARGLSLELYRILNDDILAAAQQAGAGRSETTSLSTLLLRGWAHQDLRGSGDAISSDQLREAILVTSDEFRRQLLQTTRRWWGDAAWQDRAVELLKTVWPRQRVVRSAATTDAIAILMVEADARFPELLAMAGDLLEPLPGMAAMWSYNVERLKSLIERFPDEVLDFLSRLLPEDAANWPYRAETFLERLEATNFARDNRLQELRRRWSARHS
ncbi:MAG: SIR2 family protein [Pseudomonadota bacterium]|nr:SIR2 family protein [Pseudomonadota bacterium]